MKNLKAIREEHQRAEAKLIQAAVAASVLEGSPQALPKINRSVFFDPTDERSLLKPPKIKPAKPSRLHPSDEQELYSFRL